MWIEYQETSIHIRENGYVTNEIDGSNIISLKCAINMQELFVYLVTLA